MANPIRKPVVALVGRPNVGKSALFNRLAGRTISIVHDQPGVTRDRVSAPCSLTAVPCDLVDTGGIGSLDNIDFSEAVSTEAQIAMDTAEVILFIVDAREGLTPVDQAIAQQLRKAAAHVCLVLNKADALTPEEREEKRAILAEESGGDVHVISGVSGEGVTDILRLVADEIAAKREEEKAEAGEEEEGWSP